MASFVFLFAWIFAVVVQGRNYTTWMADHASLLSPKPLRNISLVATHDSGTYNLSNNLVNIDSYGPPFTTLYNCLDEVAIAIGQPLAHLVGLFVAGIRATGQCTTKNISSQLIDGNRGLDLRLSVFENDIYLTHVLQGPALSDVLTQVSQFLHATSGEIVFMTLGHPYGFNQTYINRLAALLNPFLLDGTAITPAKYSGDLLNYTYGQLFTNHSSRVIIVVNNTINPDMNSFFSTSDYSPPDGGSDELYGFYTNIDDITIVIDNQTANYDHALDISAPAAIIMTLTPTDTDTASIIVNTIVAQLTPATRPIALAIFRAALAAENMNGPYNTYVSLYNIYVHEGMIARRTSIVKDIQPISATPNIFLIYTDFYENNKTIIDLGILYSTK
jgi:hypothetical protein